MVGYRLLDYEGAMTLGATTFAPRAAIPLGATLLTRPALAQVHWDASAQVGVMKRFLADKSGDDAGFGPIGQLTGHVALLPLIHAGGYFGHDISPVSGEGATRDIT